MEQGAYGEVHLEVLQRVANHISGAMAASFLHSVVQQEAMEKEVLAEISKVINSSSDIQDTYQGFTQQVRRLIPFKRLSISILSSDHSHARVAYFEGANVPGLDASPAISLGGTAGEMAVNSREPVLLTLDQVLEMASSSPPDSEYCSIPSLGKT